MYLYTPRTNQQIQMLFWKLKWLFGERNGFTVWPATLLLTNERQINRIQKNPVSL